MHAVSGSCQELLGETAKKWQIDTKAAVRREKISIF